MMEIKVHAYGIARDILGAPSRPIQLPENATVRQLKKHLESTFPGFSELASLAIAVNAEYATDEQFIRSSDEVVIIPPVAGG